MERMIRIHTNRFFQIRIQSGSRIRVGKNTVMHFWQFLFSLWVPYFKNQKYIAQK